MDIDELVQKIEKLQYQVKLLGDTVDFKEHPIEYLVVSMDWTEEDLDRVHDVFDKYDQKLTENESIRWGEFEKDLDTDYQTIKRIVRAFYRNDQWSDVCYAYVKNMDPVPIELKPILNNER